MNNAKSKYLNGLLTQTIRQTLGPAALLALACLLPARTHATDHRAPTVPPNLAVPADNKVHFHAYAVGFQNYTWNGETGLWVFTGPEATLYDSDGSVVGIHYADNGNPATPAWQSNSGSKVVAHRLAASTVDPSAIPWLLLQATSTQGPGIFKDVSYVQRVNTAGGKAPASPGTADGQVASVPYTAEYFFYRATD